MSCVIFALQVRSCKASLVSRGRESSVSLLALNALNVSVAGYRLAWNCSSFPAPRRSVLSPNVEHFTALQTSPSLKVADLSRLVRFRNDFAHFKPIIDVYCFEFHPLADCPVECLNALDLSSVANYHTTLLHLSELHFTQQ